MFQVFGGKLNEAISFYFPRVKLLIFGAPRSDIACAVAFASGLFAGRLGRMARARKRGVNS
ncbi:MAG: hypothetical protein ISQ19_02240 [PS1 clade bacterium]|uniref:Uncharacterized protein n=1 Tax=PS1 clade bacterium TaxID=2175152 RepID=A0A937HML2_9PROT|nr:hypothetical protein [PS1 clade bacterium]